MSEDILLNLVRRVRELEEKVFKLETDAIIKTAELPTDVLEESGLLPKFPSNRRGVGYRPLLKSEIEQAIAKSKSMAGAARRLHVSAKTLKKYARSFSIWAPTRTGRKKQ